MIIASVIGARPNIIKMAPIHKKLINHATHLIIHTGQHYDYQMSAVFFKNLIHRAENTDSPAVLKSIVDALRTVDDMTIVFPIHPRTRKILQDMGLYLSLEESKHIRLISPAGYVDFINLMKSAHKVVTDSGGVQKEAYLLGAPCITIRENTEWVETVDENKNILVGTETQAIVRAIREWEPSTSETNPIFGKGNTSDEISNIVIRAI